MCQNKTMHTTTVPPVSVDHNKTSAPVSAKKSRTFGQFSMLLPSFEPRHSDIKFSPEDESDTKKFRTLRHDSIVLPRFTPGHCAHYLKSNVKSGKNKSKKHGKNLSGSYHKDTLTLTIAGYN